jgi:hypothetical protein
VSGTSEPTQDDLDARLQADGGRWRASQPAPPEPDLDRLAHAGERRAIRWQPLAAAAAVLLLAGGVVAVAAALAHPSNTDPGDTGLMPPAVRPQPALSQLVVHDGDLAGASGQVVAVAGRPVRLCAPVATPAIGTVGKEPPPSYCSVGVTLLGADLGRLVDRTERDGVIWGDAWIEGRYRAGTLTVVQQGKPRPPAPDTSFPDQPPCAPPPDGWAGGQLDNDGLNRLSAYLEAHPDRYGELGITYPDGLPTGPTDSPGYVKTQVALVGTVVDMAAAYRELRPLFPGNLCVTRVPHNRIQVDAVLPRVTSIMDDARSMAYQAGPDYFAGKARIDLVVVDQRMYQILAAADRGTGIVAAEPWLTRVG